MTSIGWPFVEVVAQLLDRDEREVVLGDFVETGENAAKALLDVLGLVFRREMGRWKNWQPWLAGFGLALPGSFLLMGMSVSVSLGYQQLRGHRIFEGFLLLACQTFLLLAWSWSSGVVVGALSRRTLWASIALCFSPCLFCLARFRIPSLSRLSLVLFLLPAIVGVCQGVRRIRIRESVAMSLALAVTALMVFMGSSRVLWFGNGLLIWPAWYLAVIAWKSDRETRRTE